MRRIEIPERRDWRPHVEALGFFDHSLGGRYWDESVCYSFTEGEIDKFKRAARELHALSLEAVEHVVQHDLFDEIGIDHRFVPAVVRSWERRDFYLYGRFDFAFNGAGEPKLLEYNADSPGALLESSVIQLDWQQSTFPDASQFNDLSAKLIRRWREVTSPPDRITFTSLSGARDDLSTIHALQDTAIAAGLCTEYLPLEEIGWNGEGQYFINRNGERIVALCKIYPWELLLADPYGEFVLNDLIAGVEPLWKMVMSSKGFLKVLWDLFPDHPNLLPTTFDSTTIQGSWVSKPLFGSRGNGIEVGDNRTAYKAGETSNSGRVYQTYTPLYQQDGTFAVCGIWMVGDTPAALSVRESTRQVTGEESTFVPHIVERCRLQEYLVHLQP